jgi:hypothetical protein
MARVTVTPETFTLVNFDSTRIAELASRIAEDAGIAADTEIRIEVDETNPFGRTAVESLDPLVIKAEGGSFEDPKRPKQMSEKSIAESLGRILYCAADRLSGSFEAAPADAALTMQQQTAWDAYALGRCARAGLPVAQPRRQYAFRNRHGFTDRADAAFDRLWNAEGLTWADIEAVCAETAAAGEVPAAS